MTEQLWGINFKEIWIERVTVKAKTLEQAMQFAEAKLENNGGELEYLDSLDRNTWSAFNYDTGEYVDDIDAYIEKETE